MTRVPIAMVLNAIGLGGVPEVVYHLLRLLPRDRFERHLFVLRAPEDEAEARTARLSRLESIGVAVTFARGQAGRASGIAELADWLVERRIGLLHTHSYRPNLYARLSGALCRPRGLRVVAHYHNVYRDKWDGDPSALALERHLSQVTDAMLAVSRLVAAHVTTSLGLDESRVEVVENGVEVERFAGLDRARARAALGLPPTATIVGLLGRICEQKGVDDFVEVAGRLRGRHPDARFVVFGGVEDDRLYDALCARIAALGLSDVFSFVGYVTDVQHVYAALDIVAVPSRWEGFPLVVAEAMAASRAVVATTVGAIPEMVPDGEAALLVPPREPARFAEALQTLLVDPARRQQLANAGHSRAAALSWERAAARVADIYERVLATPRRN